MSLTYLKPLTPQRLGIAAIWIDIHGEGLPEGSTIRPDPSSAR